MTKAPRPTRGQPQKYSSGPAVKISVTLDPAVADRLDAECERQEVKRSEVVNRCLDRGLPAGGGNGTGTAK